VVDFLWVGLTGWSIVTMRRPISCAVMEILWSLECWSGRTHGGRIECNAMHSIGQTKNSWSV